jgi:phosphoserine phosphatase
MDSTKLPIVVDLDGTLILEEISYKSFWIFLRKYWWKAPMLFVWALFGVAYSKKKLAQRIPIDPSSLPYNQRVIDYIRAHKGQPIVLATGADETYAHQIANHLGLFDHVIASNGVENTISSLKARKLDDYFHGGKYVYLGNSAQDLNVWKHSAYAIAVNAPVDVVAELATLGVPYEVWPTK